MARRKTESEFVVLAVKGFQEEGDFAVVKRGCASTPECKQWIKETGGDGMTYQVAILRGGLIRLSVETVSKTTRKLTPAEAEA